MAQGPTSGPLGWGQGPPGTIWCCAGGWGCPQRKLSATPGMGYTSGQAGAVTASARAVTALPLQPRKTELGPESCLGQRPPADLPHPFLRCPLSGDLSVSRGGPCHSLSLSEVSLVPLWGWLGRHPGIQAPRAAPGLVLSCDSVLSLPPFLPEAPQLPRHEGGGLPAAPLLTVSTFLCPSESRARENHPEPALRRRE